MQRRTSHFLLLGHVLLEIRQLVNYAREESSSFTKEFGLVRKELESAKEEFGLAKLLSWLAAKESGRLRKEF